MTPLSDNNKTARVGLQLRQAWAFFPASRKRAIRPPFEAKVESGRIKLVVPCYAVVRALRNCLCSPIVHNGRNWGREGILDRQDNVILSFPLTSRISVSAQGRKWKLWHAYPPVPISFRKFSLQLRSNRLLLYSAIAHIGGFAILLLLAVYSPRILQIAGHKDVNQNHKASPRPVPQPLAQLLALPWSLLQAFHIGTSW